MSGEYRDVHQQLFDDDSWWWDTGSPAYDVSQDAFFGPVTIGVSFAELDVPQPPPVEVQAGSVASRAAVGQPAVESVTSSEQTVNPSGVASRAAVGAPAVASTLQIDASGVATRAAVGSPAVGSVASAAASSVASRAAVGTPAAGSVVQAAPSGVASAAAVGEPLVSVGLVSNVQAGSVGSRAQVGEPFVGSVLPGEQAEQGGGGPDADDEPAGPHRAPRRVRRELPKVPVIAEAVVAAPVAGQPHLTPGADTAPVDTALLEQARADVAAATEQAREAVRLVEERVRRERLLRLVLLVDALDD